jgi:tetratricopeptide (TPR) repeat protein
VLTPDAAYALVVRTPLARAPFPRPDQTAVARKVLEAQAARDPKAGKWAYALAHLASAEAEQAAGKTAEKKREEAHESFERAAELQPGHADGQFWLANSCFEHIDDVGMLSKMSLASQGRKAFEKAIALDPEHVGARVGLAQFYLQAPSLAGGDPARAKELANQLLALPGKCGEFQGHMLLAGIAAKDGKWAEMSRHYVAAETAPGQGAEPLVAMQAHAATLLGRANDPKAALPVMERYVKAAPADDVSAWFFDGEVKRQQGRCAEAVPRYEQVIAKVESARGSRWGAAVCHEQLGHQDAARKDYQEFVRRFPDDPRAKEAQAALKRL